MLSALVLSLAAVVGLYAAGPPKPGRILRVPLNVQAPSGEAPPQLRLSDLRAVMEGGREPKLLSLKTPKDDLMLLLVTDLTGDLMLADAARSALTTQLQELPPNVWVGMMRAQDGLHVETDPSAARQPLLQALERLQVSGKAGLLDTVQSTVSLADRIAQKAAVRVAILYVTDSDVRNYREDFTNPVINSSDSRDLSRRFPEGLIREKTARLAENLAATGTPVFIVHLQYSAERLNEAYQGGLGALAITTGGSSWFCRTPSDIPGSIAAAISAARSQYVLRVQLPEKAPKSVHLMVTAGDHAVTARSRYSLP